MYGCSESVKSYMKPALSKIVAKLEKVSVASELAGPIKVEALKALLLLVQLYGEEVAWDPVFLHFLAGKISSKTYQARKIFWQGI